MSRIKEEIDGGVMTFEEMFKSWTLEQKVEWALGPNICNLSENIRSIIVDLKNENERLKAELEKDVTRKTKHALWIARSERAKCEKALHHNLYRLWESQSPLSAERFRKKSKLWNIVYTKCLEKAKEYE